MLTSKFIKQVAIQGIQTKHSYSISAKIKNNFKKNEDIVPNSKYINQNPRNLEKLSIARRDRGWGNGNEQKESTNFPSRFYYHRVFMDKTGKNVTIGIEHANGNTVVKSSSLEPLIRKKLFSGVDVSACENVARILAERCLRSGITCVHWPSHQDDPESVRAAQEAMKEVGVSLEEPQPRNLQYDLPIWKKTGPKPLEVDGVEDYVRPKQVPNHH